MRAVAVLFDSATRRLLGAGWLQGPRFDLPFLAAIPALALVCGALVSLDRHLLLPLLLADLALLAQPGAHTLADRNDKGRDPLFPGGTRAALMPLVLWTGLGTIAFLVAAWLPATLYFYWQWFHGAQRSWSVVESYRLRSDHDADLGDRALLTAAFYMVPAWGILRRCAQAPDDFIGLGIHLMPVPQPMVQVIGIAACGAVVLWLIERALAWREGRLPLGHTLYALSHVAVFAAAYCLIEDIVAGWLVAQVWRSGQDLCLARLLRHAGFAGGTAPLRAWLSDAQWLVLGVVVMIGGTAAILVDDAELVDLLAVVAILFLVADAGRLIAASALRRTLRQRRGAPLARSKTGPDTRFSGPSGNVVKIT